MLKELKQQLEQAKSHGEKELPQGLREDERFRLLLRMLEKQVGAANRRGGALLSALEHRLLLQGEKQPNLSMGVVQSGDPLRGVPGALHSHQQKNQGIPLPSKCYQLSTAGGQALFAAFPCGCGQALTRHTFIHLRSPSSDTGASCAAAPTRAANLEQ